MYNDSRMDPTTSRYCEVLEGLIEQRGTPKVELERKLGWSRGALTKLLKSRKKLAVDDMLALLAALDVEPLSFYAMVYSGEKSPAREAPWTKAFGPLGPAARPLVLSRLLTEEELDERIRKAVARALSPQEDAET